MYNERGMVLGGVIRDPSASCPVRCRRTTARACDSIVVGVGGLDRGGANNLICPDGHHVEELRPAR